MEWLDQPPANPSGGVVVNLQPWETLISGQTPTDKFFQVAHYAIRPWPWIITGLATVMLYPNGIGPTHDKEAAYVQAFVDLLPTPWRGVMMAGFAAAYMSTVGTQLNWGASYLVNDFYRRFLNKTAPDKHYVTVSRWATVILFLLSVIVTSQIDTVGAMWELLLALGSGTGLVLILRWYWWRINAWSEISAMIASFVVSVTALTLLKARMPAGSPLVQSYAMLITVAISTIVWLSVTMLTAPEPEAKLEAFYQRVRPGGPGWRRVAAKLGYAGETIPGGALAWTNWLSGIVAVYASLFGIGKIVFGEVGRGVLLLLLAAAAFAWIAKAFREEDAGVRAQRDIVPATGD